VPTITRNIVTTSRADKIDAKANPFRTGSPLGFQAGDDNLYRYVKNDPATLTDSGGLLAVEPSLAAQNPATERSEAPETFVAAGPFDVDLDASGNPIPRTRTRLPDPGPGPPLPPGLLLPPTDEERRLMVVLFNPDGTPREIQECGIPIRGIIRLVGSIFGRARVAAPIIGATVHGAQRLAERGFTPAVVLETRAGHILRQADGCTVYVRQVEPGRFNVLIENAQGNIVSAISRIDALALRNLAINYGWRAP
jgi:hypothetical protein